MSFAGGKMRFGKGYLGGNTNEPGEGGKPEAMPHEAEPNEGGEEHHAAIHEHLKDMHAMTGKAHSHVEHHGDGQHTAHHISAEGQMHDPEQMSDGDCPGGMCGGGSEMM